MLMIYLARFACRGVIVLLGIILAIAAIACNPVSPVITESTASVGTVEPVVVTQPPPDFTPPPSAVPPTPSPIPTLPGGSSPTELKYRVLAEFPDFFFCDPDYYPVAQNDELDLARQRFPEIQANTEDFEAILAHIGLAGISSFTDDQILLIYREHKRLTAIPFELTPDGYRFQIQVAETEGEGELITGLIDNQGNITVLGQSPSIAACPICLAAGSWIDTPTGPVPVESVRMGTVVWTVDKAGERVAQPVVKITRTVAPSNHRVVHLSLDDGRELWVSPGHPTVGGGSVGQLQAGDSLDGALILSAERVRYYDYATYDLLPAGKTGFYWANGILIASSLVEHPALPSATSP